MARRLIVMFWAVTLLGCSSLTTVHLVNATDRKITYLAEYRPTSGSPRATCGSLEPGASRPVVENEFGPRGELVVSLQGGRKERFAIQGSSSGASIWCQVKKDGASVIREPDRIGRALQNMMAAVLTMAAVIGSGLLAGRLIRQWRTRHGR